MTMSCIGSRPSWDYISLLWAQQFSSLIVNLRSKYESTIQYGKELHNTNLPLAFLFSNNFSTMWLYSSPPATPESFVSFSFTATQIPLLERSLSSSSKAWKKWGKICYWKVTDIVMTLPKKSGKCIGKKKWILGGEIWEPNLSD